MKIGFRPVAFNALLLLAFTSTPALATEPVSVLEKRKSPNKPIKSQISVVAAIDSGVGSYQDIQLPASTTPGFRADGRRVGIENVQHIGIPVRGLFQLEYGTYSRNIFAELSMMQIAALVSPSEVSDSQYDRIEGSLGGKWGMITSNSTRLSILGMFGYRRDRYQNISAGHYLTAMIPKIGLGISPNQHWNLTVLGGAGINPIFGYSDGDAPQEISGSVASLLHFEGSLKYRLDPSAAIAIGGEYERSQVSISDTSEYEQLGLTVAPEINSNRNYDLVTTIGFLRLEKRF